MVTAPKVPKDFAVPKLAVSATFGSFVNDDQPVAGMATGWLYVHVTDAQGYELPPDQQPSRANFQLFELVRGEREPLVPVELGNPGDFTVAVGPLRETVHSFALNHPAHSDAAQPGQVRMIPFMLVVVPAGTVLADFAKAAGTAFLSFAVKF